MAIDKLPNTPNVGSEVPKSLWDWLIKVGDKVNQIIPLSNAHASTHATRGSDALIPGDIGAATSGHNHNSTYAAIDQASWTEPTLLNSWVNFGSRYAPAGYVKDTIGFVHLRGCIKSGTVGSAAFTLPAGSIPAYEMVFPAYSNVYGGIVIATNGDVVPVSPTSNASVFLDNIIFRAEA